MSEKVATVAAKALVALLYSWWVPLAAWTMDLHWVQIVSLWLWATIGAVLYGEACERAALARRAREPR